MNGRPEIFRAYRHNKNGGRYTVLDIATNPNTGAEIVTYQTDFDLNPAEVSPLYWRPLEEFVEKFTVIVEPTFQPLPELEGKTIERTEIPPKPKCPPNEIVKDGEFVSPELERRRVEAFCDERNPAEGNDEIPPATEKAECTCGRDDAWPCLVHNPKGHTQ